MELTQGKMFKFLKWIRDHIPLKVGIFFLFGLFLAGVVIGSWFQLRLDEIPLLKTHYPSIQFSLEGDVNTWVLQKKRPTNWVSLGEVSPAARNAIVVSEDWAFYEHSGIDIEQLKDAILESFLKGHLVRGASTISQQVARNVFLSQERTLSRKLREFLVTMRMESLLKKSRILEIYFNIVQFGFGIYGIRDAASNYFGKLPSELTAREGAFLAMLLPSPVRYAVSFREKRLTQYARQTIRSILHKMEVAGYLDEHEYYKALDEKFGWEQATSLPSLMDQHFENELEEESGDAPLTIDSDDI